MREAPNGQVRGFTSHHHIERGCNMSESDSNEQWRPIIGYEGAYEVSSHGRVRSLKRLDRLNRWRGGRILKWRVDIKGAGYVYIQLCLHGVAKKCNVHVLVLEAFQGPRPGPAYEACHQDGRRDNARLDNLRWDTAQGNARDKLLHGTDARGEKSGGAVLDNELVRWIRESQQSSLKLAPLLGVASSTIRAVRIGQNWSHLS